MKISTEIYKKSCHLTKSDTFELAPVCVLFPVWPDVLNLAVTKLTVMLFTTKILSSISVPHIQIDVGTGHSVPISISMYISSLLQSMTKAN